MGFTCPIPIEDYDAVTLAHGGGGRITHRLISELLLPTFDNPALRELGDGAVVPWTSPRLAVSTDGFVVRPWKFPGGDIGSLAVHGTTNDLAMCGARPVGLTLGMILEEGFLLRDLWTVLSSVREACDALALPVVTGDTKVVDRGHGDGVYLHTTGFGAPREGVTLAPSRVRAGDLVIVSGPVAEHGIAILSQREGLEFETVIESDSAALWPIVESLLDRCGDAVHALRDATRGGVASVVNEIAQASSTGIVLEHDAVPVRDTVRGACELLGLDPLYVANEGRFLAFVSPEAEADALDAVRSHANGRGATRIGRVVESHPGVVRLDNAFGGSRVVDMMSGEQLPRIC